MTTTLPPTAGAAGDGGAERTGGDRTRQPGRLPPRRRPPARRRVPRRPVALTPVDVVYALVAAASSICLCWLVFSVLTNGIGWFGFWLVAYLVFLAIYFVTTVDRLGRLAATDRMVTVVVWSAMIVVLVPLVWLTVYVLVKGLPGLSLGFFTHTQQGVVPKDPATAGGALHAIVGTLEQVGIALLISLPLGAMTAIFLNETRSRLRRPVRIFVDAMSGMPSVVSGLFIYATLIIPLAKDSSLFGYDGFMASLALSVTMMPTICRAIEVVLRLVPAGLREAGLALGSSRAKVVWSVVLPTASSGVATAAILGIAREAGETAPLLFTAFGYNLMNANPFGGSQESLPLFIWRFIREPLASSITRGFAGALVLMVLILVLFAVARIVGRDRTKARTRRWGVPRGRSRTGAGPLPTLVPPQEPS
ncbi:MAG TPA: phosphate ABC transporter permease PstA [Acidimicrobiales bacterium]|nr:phosphate ABC transporter permease PstA [Acidimicrobiales bacterium]